MSADNAKTTQLKPILKIKTLLALLLGTSLSLAMARTASGFPSLFSRPLLFKRGLGQQQPSQNQEKLMAAGNSPMFHHFSHQQQQQQQQHLHVGQPNDLLRLAVGPQLPRMQPLHFNVPSGFDAQAAYHKPTISVDPSAAARLHQERQLMHSLVTGSRQEQADLEGSQQPHQPVPVLGMELGQSEVVNKIERHIGRQIEQSLGDEQPETRAAASGYHQHQQAEEKQGEKEAVPAASGGSEEGGGSSGGEEQVAQKRHEEPQKEHHHSEEHHHEHPPEAFEVHHKKGGKSFQYFHQGHHHHH